MIAHLERLWHCIPVTPQMIDLVFLSVVMRGDF